MDYYQLKHLLASNKWYKQQGPGNPLFISIAARSGFKMKKKLGYGYSHFVFYYKESTGEMHYNVKDFHNIFANVQNRLKKDPTYLDKLENLHKKAFYSLHAKYTKSKAAAGQGKASQKTLMKMFRMSSDLLSQAVGEGHVIEAMTLLDDSLLHREISNYVKEKNQESQIVEILIKPSTKSFASQYHEQIEKIAAKYRKQKNIRQIDDQIQEIISRFYWINNSYTGARPLTKKQVMKDIIEAAGKHSARPAKEKKDLPVSGNIINSLKGSVTMQIASGYNIPAKTIALAKMFRKIAAWHDERKEMGLRSISEVSEWIERIGSQYKIDPQLLKYCSFEEISTGKFSHLGKELAQRKKGCIYFQNGENKGEFFSGKKANDLHKLISDLPKNQNSSETIIRGTSASRGFAPGKVFICMDMKAIAAFPKGAILVASNTRPEYLPAMKKAIAIITNEGGMTNHAAIVSRELGIPCIVGAKHSTTLLKTGMEIEVNADKGEIRIISKR